VEVHDEERGSFDQGEGRIALIREEQVQEVTTREDFVAFARSLGKSLEAEPNGWINQDLASFLDALAAWSEDMDGYYLNRGEPIPQQPTWITVADMLAAAAVYE
jgi:hypothetical protein